MQVEPTGEYRLPSLIQQSLIQVLFSGTTRPLTVVESSMAPLWQGWLAEQGEVRVAAADATYLTNLQEAIVEVKPDCLFLIAPFLSQNRLSATLRKSYPRLDLHEIALQLALEQAPADCRIGAWMAHGFCINQSSQSLRDQINRTATPRWLIDFSFPSALSPVPLIHLFVLDNTSTNDKILRSFRFPETIFRQDGSDTPDAMNARQNGILADLRKLKKQGGGATEFGYVLRQGLPDNTPWLFERHHPLYQSHLQDLQAFGGVRALGELVETRLGFNPRDMINELIPGRETSRGIPVITGQDIALGNRPPDMESRYRLLSDEVQPYLLQAGDICIPAIVGHQRKLKALLVEEGMLPLVANHTVVVLRPRPEINLDIEFLVAYLQSDHIVQTLQAQGIAQRLYIKTLTEVPVPVQDDELRSALQNLRAAAQTLGKWQADAAAAMQALFAFTSAKDARFTSAKDVRALVLATGRRVRQREMAARQVDDLSYRLRTGLPHPLAYRWRLAETAQPTLEGYREVLECAETVITFLGLIALIMMRVAGESVGYLTEMSDRLTNKNRGTNLGDWVAILDEVKGNKALRSLNYVPFYEVARFLDEAKVYQSLTTLKENRNANAHGRGPHGAEIGEKITESMIALRTLLEATEFLSSYPIHYIETTKRDSITGITRYQYRTIMGDHVAVPVLSAEITSSELEAGSLYLVDRQGTPHLLRPYMVRKECKVCGRWEIFYLDSFKKNVCTLKSMEKGHTFEDREIASVFRFVNMLL